MAVQGTGTMRFHLIESTRRMLRRMARMAGRLLFLWLVAELLIRGTVWWTGSHDVCQSDPAIGWRLKPNLTTIFSSSAGPYLYESNSRGLRDREYPLEPPRGRMRVAVLGSSTVFGDGVDQSWLFAQKLERNLGDADVINVSMPATSVDQHYLMLREIALPYRPNIVVHFLVQTDATDPFWPWQFSINRRKCWLSYKDGEVAINPPDQNIIPRAVESSYVCMGMVGISLHLLLGTQFDLDEMNYLMEYQHRLLTRQQLTREERVEAILQLLRKTRMLCLENGCEYVVAYLPARSEFEGKTTSEAILVRNEILRRLNRDDGVKVIDSLADVLSLGDGETSNALFDEFHLNANGHAVVSEKLAVALEPLLEEARGRANANAPVPSANAVSDEG